MGRSQHPWRTASPATSDRFGHHSPSLQVRTAAYSRLRVLGFHRPCVPHSTHMHARACMCEPAEMQNCRDRGCMHACHDDLTVATPSLPPASCLIQAKILRRPGLRVRCGGFISTQLLVRLTAIRTMHAAHIRECLTVPLLATTALPPPPP